MAITTNILGRRVTLADVANAEVVVATTLAAPAADALSTSANVVNSSADVLVLSTGHNLSVNAYVKYTRPTNNTADIGLTANNYYYITFANATGVALSSTKGGSNVNIYANTTGNETHNIQHYEEISNTGIRYVAWSGNTTISRGSTVLLKLFDSGELDLASRGLTVELPTANGTANIVCNTVGTYILDISKKSNFS